MKKKPAQPTDAWHHAARKIGESVRFSFGRCIKQEMKCEDREAEAIFETAVQSGIIIQTDMAGIVPTVPKYRMK